jgi:hypothetical protein
MNGMILMVIVAVVVLLILLEGKRQERKYGKPQGGNLLGAGMLELQRILEPERKVEILQEEQEVDERAVSGDPPEAGRES